MASENRVVPLSFPVLCLLLGSTVALGVQLEALVLLGGLLCCAYSAWRFARPGWVDDPFWKSRPRLRDWLAMSIVPDTVARRLRRAEPERVHATVGIVWGLTGVLIGAALLA